MSYLNCVDMISSKRKIWSRGMPFVVNVPLNLFRKISESRLITMQLANEGPVFICGRASEI